MRGTDSNDVVLEDLFVPVRRTFPLTPVFEPGSHYGGPLYRMSSVSLMTGIIAPLALAVAREAIEALRSLAPAKMLLTACVPARRSPARVYGAAGSSAIYERSLTCESRFETVGKVLLGVEPEFAFDAF